MTEWSEQNMQMVTTEWSERNMRMVTTEWSEQNIWIWDLTVPLAIGWNYLRHGEYTTYSTKYYYCHSTNHNSQFNNHLLHPILFKLKNTRLTTLSTQENGE